MPAKTSLRSRWTRSVLLGAAAILLLASSPAGAVELPLGFGHTAPRVGASVGAACVAASGESCRLECAAGQSLVIVGLGPLTGGQGFIECGGVKGHCQGGDPACATQVCCAIYSSANGVCRSTSTWAVACAAR